MPYSRTLSASGVGPFPQTRLRRTRQDAWNRRLVSETNLAPHDLIWPIFIRTPDAPADIASMPGVTRLTIDELLKATDNASKLGIGAITLFPFVAEDLKTGAAQEALNPSNLLCQALRALKKEAFPLGIIADVALDPYTSHGHDGVTQLHPDGKSVKVLNDETLDILTKQALLLVEAGAQVVSPSDMMDGRVGKIRQTLDAAGHTDTRIFSYSVKYASAFYGPFREAVGSLNALKGDSKATYQMDPANSDEAMREIAQDIQEGADMIIIKPGMPYLDIIRRVQDTFSIPTLAYQVSGEHAMITAAAQQGWLDYDRAVMESLISFKRAGAEGIISYFAPHAASLMKHQCGI